MSDATSPSVDWDAVIRAMPPAGRAAFNRWRSRLYDLASDLDSGVGMFQEWAVRKEGQKAMRSDTAATAHALLEMIDAMPILGESLLEGDAARPSADFPRPDEILSRLEEIQAIHTHGKLLDPLTGGFSPGHSDPELRAIAVALKLGVLISDLHRALRGTNGRHCDQRS